MHVQAEGHHERWGASTCAAEIGTMVSGLGTLLWLLLTVLPPLVD